MSTKVSDAQNSYSRKKEEEEAKRAKDRAERQNVLRQFEDYFNESDEESKDDLYAAPSGGKRHRAPGALTASGPGTLEDEVQVRPLPKKQRLQPNYMNRGKHSAREGLASSDRASGRLAFRDDYDDDDEEGALANSAGNTRSAKQATAKPTVQLQNLPVGVSEAKIKGLLPEAIRVLGVRINPPPPPPPLYGEIGDRRSMTAHATLHQDTAGRDIDEAIKSLENKYIGFGHYLKISRGLSSNAMDSQLTTHNLPLHSALVSQPFGARMVVRDPLVHSLSRAPPPSEYGAQVPPPELYDAPAQSQPPVSQISVLPPPSLNELKAIHRTIETVLTMGPQLEALLMSRPEVQNEEKWAWIWNARSRGGVYYRWRLWSIMTGSQSGSNRKPKEHDLFQRSIAWADPGRDLPFEFMADIGDLDINSDYDSSGEEESDDEGNVGLKRFDHATGVEDKPGAGEDADMGDYLDPMQKGKLLFLLANLPTTTAKLTQGDVAQVMAFAMHHATSGAAEVVELLAINVLHPFSTQPDFKLEEDSEDFDNDNDGDEDENDEENADEAPRGLGAPREPQSSAKDSDPEESKQDDSSAHLVGLYLINDIMSASSTGDVRSAWRYRTAFEIALKKYNIFGKLGRLDRDLKMGRMTSDKWKRSIRNLLDVWQECSTFGTEAHGDFLKAFETPPLTAEEQEIEDKKAGEKRAVEKPRETGGLKVPGKKGETSIHDHNQIDNDSNDKPTNDTNAGEQQHENDVSRPSSVFLDEAEFRGGESSNATGTRETSKCENQTPDEKPQPRESQTAVNTAGTGGIPNRRGRARAEDMFADSD